MSAGGPKGALGVTYSKRIVKVGGDVSVKTETVQPAGLSPTQPKPVSQTDVTAKEYRGTFTRFSQEDVPALKLDEFTRRESMDEQGSALSLISTA